MREVRAALLVALVAAQGDVTLVVRAASPDSAPPLPPPSGNVVRVSTVNQLQSAMGSLSSGRTILIAPGTYNLTTTLHVNGALSNVTIRGESNNRDDVVLVGRGMTNPNYGQVQHGIWTGGGVSGLTIANLTIRDVYFHPIIFNAGTQSPRVYNVRLVNAGQQFIKSNPDDAGGGVDNGVVEYSVFEYETTARDNYTNGVDILTSRNWIIRHNLFRRMRAPQGQLAGPTILAWRGSSGTIAEGNTFIDCQREIAFGLDPAGPNDHTGGIIRNNFIVRQAGLGGDAAISVFDSPNTKVLHNTVLMSGGYPNAIEYRFPDTAGVLILNNLVDGRIQSRDGATAVVEGNDTSATAALFVNPAAGDLHLQASATSAIDRAIDTADAPLDWDNQTRPPNAGRDLGADEYQPGPGGALLVVDAGLRHGQALFSGPLGLDTFVRVAGLGVPWADAPVASVRPTAPASASASDLESNATLATVATLNPGRATAFAAVASPGVCFERTRSAKPCGSGPGSKPFVVHVH